MGFSTHLRCDQLVEIASDYLERELNAADAERLEQHLLICGACAEYLAQIRAVRDAARKLATEADAGLDSGERAATARSAPAAQGRGRPMIAYKFLAEIGRRSLQRSEMASARSRKAGWMAQRGWADSTLRERHPCFTRRHAALLAGPAALSDRARR